MDALGTIGQQEAKAVLRAKLQHIGLNSPQSTEKQSTA